MAEIRPEIESFARLKVAGVGGAGGAAINRMQDAGLRGVDFVAINTDAQALHHANAPTKVNLGKETTRGLGAGADPAVGKLSAEESREEIKQQLAGADMVFVTYGAGGGTGSGAGPVISQISRELGILTVGIVTKPFSFEGEKRRRNAETSIEELKKQVDTLIVIPNDKLLQTIDRDTSLVESFRIADDVLRQGVQGISGLITTNGLINLDFADVKAIMSNAGSALMGIGEASGENRAVEAAKEAIESPLLDVSIDGARGVLFSITGGKDMSMHEINEAAEVITSAVDPDANIIFGANIDDDLEDKILITVIATGFDRTFEPQFRDYTQTSNTFMQATQPTPQFTPEPQTTIEAEEEDVSDIDMSVSEPSMEPQRHIIDDDDDDDDPTKIWSVETEEKSEEREVPAFLRRRFKRDDK